MYKWLKRKTQEIVEHDKGSTVRLDNFRELLAKKAGDPDLENVIRFMREDILVDIAFESLEKMADNKGTKANSALTSFAGSMKNVDASMLHDALGHHVSKYRSALQEGNRKVADQHLERTMHLADFAARAAKHSHGKLSFDHVPTNAWEMNYTSDAKRVDKNGKMKYVQDQKGLGRRLPTKNKENSMFPDYRYMEQDPHTSYKHTSRLRDNSGGYPFEEMKVNGKHIVVDHDDKHTGKYEEHEFDNHPIFDKAGSKSHWEHDERKRSDDDRSGLAQKMSAWDSDSEHVDKWLDRHEAMEDADSDSYAARGSKPSKSALDNVNKGAPKIDTAKLPEHLRHLAEEKETEPDEETVDDSKLPDHLKHLNKGKDEDEFGEGFSVIDPENDTAEGDDAEKWLNEQSEKKDKPEKKVPRSKRSSHIDDMDEDEFKAHKELAGHWMNAANQHRKQDAEAKKNPVLFAEGHRDSAHNAAHEDYNAKYNELITSDKYKDMSSTKQMRAERKFKKDWLAENPDHYSDTASSVADAHSMHDKASAVHTDEKQKQTDHILRGAPAASPDQTVSESAAIQHAGGSRNESGVSNVSSGSNVAAGFANQNREFIEEQRQQRGDIATGAEEDVEQLDNPEKKVYRHHTLGSDDSKSRIDKLFKEYGGLIGSNIKNAKSFLRSQGIPEDSIDEGDLHESGMLGLMSALRDFEPKSGNKFHSYAGSRMQGMMRSHIGSKDPIPGNMRDQLRIFNKKKNVQSEVKQPTEVTQPTETKAPAIDKTSFSDDQHERYKRIQSAKRAQKPGEE